jgi:nitroreductase
MEFQRVVETRRMTRNFDPRPLPPEIVDRILANARRAPSAGFSQGWSFLVLEAPADTGRYWDAVLPQEARAGFAWPGLLNAPVIIVALADPQAYLERYAEADKRRSGLARSRWSTPYWHVDTAFASLLILLTAADAGLGALFFAVADFDAFRSAFGIPERFHPIGAIALGYAVSDHPSSSLRRGRRPAASIIHRGRW